MDDKINVGDEVYFHAFIGMRFMVTSISQNGLQLVYYNQKSGSIEVFPVLVPTDIVSPAKPRK
ncbi:MAG: hypothetical protein LBK94_00010 [Prevotellaceae bacterium]|jgi:hypothetical protein|nr:hypothetical protein [Prevotellaceae bacterium]